MDDGNPREILTYLRRQGRDLSDGSVRKILSILLTKGYVSREPVGRTFRYRATVDARRAKRSMLRDLADRAFGGSPALMLASLLDDAKLSKKDLKSIKQLIAEKENGR